MRKLITIILFLSIFLPISKVYANTEKLYERLINDWSTIFPDGNRNAAGPRFFKYILDQNLDCLLYTSPSPRDRTRSRMPSSA